MRKVRRRDSPPEGEKAEHPRCVPLLRDRGACECVRTRAVREYVVNQVSFRAPAHRRRRRRRFSAWCAREATTVTVTTTAQVMVMVMMMMMMIKKKKKMMMMITLVPVLREMKDGARPITG